MNVPYFRIVRYVKNSQCNTHAMLKVQILTQICYFHDTLSKKRTVIFKTMTPLDLITGLLTGLADIPVITTAQVKIPSDIKNHKQNMITHRNST